MFVMQVAVLRVRLEELEDEVKSKTSRLDELEKDRERILRDHTDSSGLHSQALDTLKVCLLFYYYKETFNSKVDDRAHVRNRKPVKGVGQRFLAALPGCSSWLLFLVLAMKLIDSFANKIMCSNMELAFFLFNNFVCALSKRMLVCR